MPSFALLVRHPTFKSLRSKITGSYSSTKSLKNGRPASVALEHGHDKSKSVSLTGDQSDKSSHDVELGLVGKLRTSITGGLQGNAPPGGIYTMHEVQQSWYKE